MKAPERTQRGAPANRSDAREGGARKRPAPLRPGPRERLYSLETGLAQTEGHGGVPRGVPDGDGDRLRHRGVGHGERVASCLRRRKPPRGSPRTSRTRAGRRDAIPLLRIGPSLPRWRQGAVLAPSPPLAATARRRRGRPGLVRWRTETSRQAGREIHPIASQRASAAPKRRAARSARHDPHASDRRRPAQMNTSVLPPAKPCSTNVTTARAIFSPPRAEGSIGLA